MSDTLNNLRLAALDRHRKRLFGDSSLTVYTTSPEIGETPAAEFLVNWSGQRTEPLTGDGQTRAESGLWQFQIPAADTWATTQTFMRKIVALSVGTQRWRVKKVEHPIGVSMVWKVRAEMQN